MATRPTDTNEALARRAGARLERMLATDPQVRAARVLPEALAELEQCGSTIEVATRAFTIYADRPCLAERSTEPGAPLRTVTFGETLARVEAFAGGLVAEGLIPREASTSFIAVCGFGSIDWVVADLALLYRALVSVPLQTNMDAGDLGAILRETGARTIVCTLEQLDRIDAVLPACPDVAALVLMNVRAGDPEDEAKVEQRKRRAAEGGPRIFTMRELEALGRAADAVPPVLPSERGEADPLLTLIYTSGSTGTPKGAMYPESLYLRVWHSSLSGTSRILPALPHVAVSYMPLNHAAGRMNVISGIVRGGVSAFVAKSDLSTLFDDIRLVRPTSLFLVPRVAAWIYHHFQSEQIRRGEGADVLGEMRRGFLGDRLLFAAIGSAPTPPEVAAFIKHCFEVPLVDVYGSTEAGLITIDGRIVTDADLRWKIVDVPELGYRTTDTPFPRGELHVRSRSMVPGYYENEAATKALFDGDGFMNTGDIVERRGPDELVWIDRAKNVVKLSQGEFVATSRLEGLFATSPLIHQIYLHGDGLHAYLAAVVVPDLDVAKAKLGPVDGELDDATLNSMVRDEIASIARARGLPAHEVPRDFLIERTPFSRERGLLTESNKPSRAKLQAAYREPLEALCARVERARTEEMERLSSDARGASRGEKVARAVGVALGLPELDATRLPQSFAQLGGDSLAAISLETMIRDMTGVTVPVGLLLDPTSSVRALVEYVEKTASAVDGPQRVTFADVHGAGAKVLHAADVRVGKLLGAEELSAAQRARPAADLPARAEVALLTGANGFLGRFLLLELLERARVHALVRAPSDAAAYERLARVYRTDERLAERFGELSAGGRLNVFAGDLMKPRFGLSAPAYERLEDEVDLVVHNGALVNHALGYEQLFEPNVIGTAEVVRLALARRIKKVAYVSTVAVLDAVRRTAPIREDEDLRTLVPSRMAESGYAAGYAASKWASELLLCHASDEMGLPVSVFRPSEIMAHAIYRGQVNVPDFFTRLLAGIVYTGTAPRSFYASEPQTFDGLPVDVVARSIVVPAVERQAASYEAFNVVNPHHGDGVSLDVITHWVTTAGYPVRRVPEYAAWYRAFEARLRTLPERKRQHSPLAIMEAWSEPMRSTTPIDSRLLHARLHAIDASLAVLPHVDEGLIHRTLDSMALLHVIDRPLRMAG